MTYRAPMRSRLGDVDEHAGVLRGLELGLCGIGGRLEVAPHDLSEALARTEATYGDRTAARLRRFTEVPDASEVWTRDPEGRFHRGALRGPWRYDESPAAHDVDLVHVRPCPWVEDEPPAEVRAAFARGGRNFQRVRAAG